MEGATLEAGTATAAFTLPPGDRRSFDWPIAVQTDSDAVTVTLTAGSVTASDAVRVVLPVRRYQTPEVVATAGTVPATGRVESIVVPHAAGDDGELLLNLEPSLAAGMLEGMDYLAHYPYECNEQTVSRFLPNLLTVRALRALDIENAALESQLSFQVGVAVQRLASRQNDDGGWGYWPNQKSSPFITSYVLWGLAMADEFGYAVPSLSLDAATSYLQRQFVAPADVTAVVRLNELAFTHFVLAEIDVGDPGRASTLYDERERLSLYGKAFLAMALAKTNRTETEDPRVETLLDDLFAGAQFSATGAAWHEREDDWANMSSDTRTSAIVLTAFLRLEPDQPMLDQAVRRLMSTRQAGRWRTTQENAWAIMALTDWMVTTNELAADYRWTASLNAASLGSGTFGPDNLDARVTLRAAVRDLLRDQANVLSITRDRDAGRLYYTTHLRYYLDALAVDARDRGLTVDRRLEIDGVPVDSADVGDVISVTVTLVAPADRHHLLVEVPLPAGAEPIDASLATESREIEPPLLQAVDIDGSRFRRWEPAYIDIRDDRVALFATYLPAGTYEYTFLMRAAVPGEYRMLPVHAEQMYFPEVWGRSAGGLFTVR